LLLVLTVCCIIMSDRKTRKPYTITKQRENWTDEEHHKFLEGLKLYGACSCNCDKCFVLAMIGEFGA
jgi:hypothetical protein